MICLKTPIISPGIIQSHNHFRWAYTRGSLLSEQPIYGTTFVSGVFHTCYLYLKKGELNKTKKTMLLQQNAILPLDSKRNM